MKTRKRWIVVAGFVVVGAGLWLTIFRQRGPGDSLVASGTVEATNALLGFQTSGRIEAVLVQEGDRVKGGVELARLDQTEMLARRSQTEAQVAAARAMLEELESGFRSEEVAQGRAALDAAEQRWNDAQRDLGRTKRLFDGGAVSQEAYDKTQLAHDVARSQYIQAQEQLKLLEKGPRRERIKAQKAQLEQAQAALRAIDATLANMSICSAFDGIVTVRYREPGETAPAGTAVMMVMNPEDRWVRIYIPETRIGAVWIGQQATISCDTYPDKTYRGEVVYIASEAEFTPKTVQTSEERVKLVYAVKVRVTDDPSHDLKPGMPADVHLELTKS